MMLRGERAFKDRALVDTIDRGDCEPALPIRPGPLQEVITAYLPLVRQVVRQLARHLPANVQHEDLLSAGVFGLVDSLRRNGGDHGATFQRYARIRIRGAVFDELRAQDWLSRRARDRVTAMTEQMGVTQTAFVSINDVIEAEDYAQFTAGENPAEAAEARCQRRALARAIAQLPEREKRIVGRHYFEGVKLKDIGAELGVSEPRISQLHARALERLKILLNRAA